ncbi:MAG: hypothetical protein ACFNJN_04700, partial [Capnocytophaga ochracea]
VTLRVQGYTPLMEIRNVTVDTIQLFSKLKKESKEASTHILGFRKEGKHYIEGVLYSCYECLEDYFYIGNTKNNTIKIAPQSSISTYFPYLSSGTYYFEIQTFYILYNFLILKFANLLIIFYLCRVILKTNLI